jgi:hypothetical protein
MAQEVKIVSLDILNAIDALLALSHKNVANAKIFLDIAVLESYSVVFNAVATSHIWLLVV